VNPQKAFQDDLDFNHCFGCGADNAQGLQIKSYWDGDETVCTFTPRAEHMAGPRHILNGGIIATVIDCHCINTAIADTCRRENRAIGSEPMVWYVTGSLKVDYLRPAPIDQPVELRARVAEASARKSIVLCTLSAQGQDCARGELVAIRVTDAWYRAT
jgi:acyl-coenzyme A thioesterase PaaI-like protein